MQPVRQDSNRLVITIPDDWVDRLGIGENDYVDVSIQAVYRRRVMDSTLLAVLERVWKENEAGFRYLADHD